jgi:riboflavin synthase
VQGHVDGVGEIIEPGPDLCVRIPIELSRYVVEKGSITVDGVSLTVVDALADGFTVAVIPHTLEVTTLGRKQAGDPVNLEVDVMAKYVERLLAPHFEQLEHLLSPFDQDADPEQSKEPQP